jgi:hypothetical protein
VLLRVVTSALSGDFNGDGMVDAADYTVWRDNFGGDESAFATGTGSGDSTIDDSDYQLWRSNFGSGGQAAGTLAAAGSVPEPSACVLLGMLAACSVAMCRCRIIRND